MKKIIMMMLLTIAVTGFIIPAHAGIFDELGSAIMGYKKTVTIEYVEVQPSKSTDSYFLVYGRDGSNELVIIELQLNSLSVAGNFDDGLGGVLNRDMLKYVVEHNIGNTITFECNGFEKSLAFMEEYPQCFKIVDIVKNKDSEMNDVVFLKNELRKATELAQEQMKVIRELTR